MQLLNSPTDLQERVQNIEPYLEYFIREKRPAISAVVKAPFEPAHCLVGDFTDASWLGEWPDVDNY